MYWSVEWDYFSLCMCNVLTLIFKLIDLFISINIFFIQLVAVECCGMATLGLEGCPHTQTVLKC